MSVTKKRKATVIVGLVVVALVVVGMLFVYSGVYSVAATKWHPAIEGALLNKVMVQSVRHQASYVQMPTGMNLHDRALAEKYGGAYAKACQTCHSAPGLKPDHWCISTHQHRT